MLQRLGVVCILLLLATSAIAQIHPQVPSVNPTIDLLPILPRGVSMAPQQYVTPQSLVSGGNGMLNDASNALSSSARANLGINSLSIFDKFNGAPSGAICDGNSHPLSGFFSTLAAAQVAYPTALSLSDEVDGVAINNAFQQVRNIISSNSQAPIRLIFPQGQCLATVSINGTGINTLGWPSIVFDFAGNYINSTVGSSVIAFDLLGSNNYTTIGGPNVLSSTAHDRRIPSRNGWAGVIPILHPDDGIWRDAS